MQPFYVGKGTKQRSLFHLWEAKKYRDGTLNKVRFLNIPKIKKIIDIFESGREPLVSKVFYGSNAECCNEEMRLICLIGRAANGGPLLNLTDGGDGTSGYTKSLDQRAAMSAARKGKPGHPHSEAHKQRLREDNRGGAATRKQVVKLTLEGEQVGVYPSMKALADELGMTKNNCSVAVVKDGSLPHNGFFYRYTGSTDITPEGIKDAAALIEQRYRADNGLRGAKAIQKLTPKGDVLATYESVRAAVAANPDTKYAALWAAAKHHRVYAGARWSYPG